MQCSHRIASRFFMRVRLFSIVCLFSGCLVLYATQPGMSIFTDDETYNTIDGYVNHLLERRNDLEE